MVRAHKFIYAKVFDGEPKVTDFQLKVEELPALKDNEVLAEAVYLSVDPYMRPYMANSEVGVTMIGGQVAKVLESRHPQFPVGANIFGQFGWRTHTIFNPDDGSHQPIPPYVLPSYGPHPLSLALGTLGMPGNTVYFGFLEICKPQPGETVVVSGAAGAVGSLVGQVAKANGCRVVGLAGSDAKCGWLRSIGFDAAINYKTADIVAELKAASPGGYDCYFDNVGGELSTQILRQMRDFGRIAVCGAISGYNDGGAKAGIVQMPMIFGQLTMRGFIVWSNASRWQEGLAKMYEMVADGRVRCEETVTVGFENMPVAFIGLLRGENTGKAVVKVRENEFL